ncbi:MAG: PKD domain-containing protein, partial [Bacteroidales bacterium]|nr:PKD domain-containing protein [Bacteroidales bacterium]
INGGTTWQGFGTFNNLAPGTYDVRIRDAVNPLCIITLNPALAITQPAVLAANIASTNVTCFGGNDGTITISGATGGYGTYAYSINGGGSWQVSGSFTALTPGSYNIQIRDAAHIGCVIVLNSAYIITQPALLTATVAKTDITCNGADDGTITLSAPAGGYGTYEYSINGGSTWQSSGNFTSLVPGTYDVRMRDAANTACSVILYPNLLITEPLILAISSTGDILLDCFGDMDGMGTFYASGGTMPYTFSVTANTTGATIAAPGFNSQTFFAAGAGTITVSVTDFKGCFAQATINITQPALLTPGSIAADQVLCSGDNPSQLTESVPATGGPVPYNYQWQYAVNVAGPFMNIASGTAYQYTPPAGATSTFYYRRMVTSGMCLPVYSNVIEVKVNPRPVAVLSGGETICPLQTSILKVNMAIGTGPYELDIENLGTVTGYISGADIVVSPAATTTYRLLRVRDANNCEVVSPSSNLMGQATVTVRILTTITASPVNRTICEFGMTTFNVTATGSDLTYQWYVNQSGTFNPVVDGGIYFGAQTPTLNLFGTTRLMNGYVYHVEVTSCSTTVTSADALLTVNTIPEIASQPKDSIICMNDGATFGVTATGSGLTYQWQVNQGSGFVNVVDNANLSGSDQDTLTITNAPGTFNNNIFRVIVSGVCGVPVYSNFAVLTVNVPPAVTINPVNKAICENGGPVTFIANGSGMIDSLRWQIYTGGTWTDIYDDAIYSGTTTQQLTLINVPVTYNGNQYRLGLKAFCLTVYTNSATLTVNSNPIVDFSAVDPINACGGIPLVIDGNPSGGSGTWSTHIWTGDIGPLSNYFIQSPTFNSMIPGPYVLNYKVKDSNGCYGHDTVTVVVDRPDAAFTQDINYGCTPATVNFTKDMTGIASFSWDFDDGSPANTVDANLVHIFTNSDPSSIEYHNVTLTVQSPNGCFDTFTTLMTVYPAIDATFTASDIIVCSGGSLTFNAMPGASRYFWEFGDGASGYSTASTNHIFTNFTTAPLPLTVRLTTTSFYNCTDVETMNITVMPVPLPGFTAAPPSQVFNPGGNPVTFTNTTNAGTWTWLWRFGDGAISIVEGPSHTYTGIGDFVVTLVVSNANCSDSIQHTVRVTPIPPIADFDSVPSGCSPLYIAINNTSSNDEAPGTTYLWDFGDGSYSTAENPTYTYFTAGTYRIELTVTGPGGVSTKPQVVSAYPAPRAYFEVAPSFVFVNDERVRCFNLSQDADSYLWEFGDGDTSKLKEPFHRYMEEGVYDITLWAYSDNGCTDKYVLSPGVTVEPAGELRFASVFTPNKEGPIELDRLPTGGTEVDQFFYPPIREKVINDTYKLQIFNRLGVLIFESHNINVPWNGYYKGKLCPQGVYVWYVEGKFANGKPFRKVGDITLLH